MWTRHGHNDALTWFYRATELDADFARPYGLAAGCYLMRKSNGWIVDRASEVRETERLARRAAHLGRDDAVALCWSGHALANPLLWGALACALNYVPYLGSAIVAGTLALVGLVMFPSLYQAAIAPLVYLAM